MVEVAVTGRVLSIMPEWNSGFTTASPPAR